MAPSFTGEQTYPSLRTVEGALGGRSSSFVLVSIRYGIMPPLLTVDEQTLYIYLSIYN